MPPLELDAITVHGDGDSAVCGTAFFVDESDKEEEHEDPYAPATSLRLRIGEDIDWCDVGGGAMVAVLRRDDSTKGAGANPKSAARRSVQAQAAAPRSSMSSYVAAQRKVVPVVIGGLPSPAAAGKVRPRRVFAAGEQQQGVVGRHHHLEEPGSPKVSCLGAVRPEQRAVGRGLSRRAWWRSWSAARVTCCFSSHQRASRGSEADD
jgi:hypothetical protein